VADGVVATTKGKAMLVRRGCIAIALAIALTTAVSQSAHAESDVTYHWGGYQGVGFNIDVPTAIGGLSGVTALAAGNISGLVLAGGNVYT
jgi:hypothetical protein